MYCNVKRYQIRYTDVDFQDNLKISALLALMEESACASADELGFGYSVLQPKNIGFVLVNWFVKLNRAIKFGEELTVHTWPIKPKRLIVFRDFELFVGEEKVGVATSRWCVVDLSTFKIINSSAVFDENMTYNENRSVEVENLRIPAAQAPRLVYSKQVTYSDYDHYNHVNNTKYADLLIDVFAPWELENKYVSSVEICYHTQCKYGDCLDFYRSDEHDCTIIEGRVGEDTRVQMRLRLNDGN